MFFFHYGLLAASRDKPMTGNKSLTHPHPPPSCLSFPQGEQLCSVPHPVLSAPLGPCVGFSPWFAVQAERLRGTPAQYGHKWIHVHYTRWAGSSQEMSQRGTGTNTKHTNTVQSTTRFQQAGPKPCAGWAGSAGMEEAGIAISSLTLP